MSIDPNSRKIVGNLAGFVCGLRLWTDGMQLPAAFKLELFHIWSFASLSVGINFFL